MAKKEIQPKDPQAIEAEEADEVEAAERKTAGRVFHRKTASKKVGRKNQRYHGV